jgi:hypothetical protein
MPMYVFMRVPPQESITMMCHVSSTALSLSLPPQKIHPPPIPSSFILCEVLVSEAGLDFPSLCMIPKVSITRVGHRTDE